MKIENLHRVAELKEELDELKRVFDSRMTWNYKDTPHFEFVEHYGSAPYKAKISRSLNEKIFPIIRDRIHEIEEEISTL